MAYWDRDSNAYMQSSLPMFYMDQRIFGKHGGGGGGLFCPTPVTFEFVNWLQANLAQNFVYSIQKQNRSSKGIEIQITVKSSFLNLLR